MQKRGAPMHVQKPVFIHPEANSSFITILEKVPDPRGASPNFSYSLTSILFIVTITVLSGAEDWEDMALMGEHMQDWIGQYVDVSSGIPSAYTLERVVSLLEPTSLEAMLRETAQLFRKKLVDDVIAIDGKSLCGSRDKANDKRAVHLLHAWSCENKICLAQMKVDDKSNEITAICALLDQLFLKGNIITTDALNTQKNTVAKIIEKEAHYVLPVKENQPGLLESIKVLFAEAEQANFRGIDADEFESLEKSRGRVEERLCKAIDASELLEAKEWRGLKTAAKMTRRRTIEGKTTEEVIYYISDLEIDATKIARAAREHWGVENGLHHALDVVLEEDGHTYRNRNGACNLSAIRKIVLAALQKTEAKKKYSKKGKRLLAAINPEFRFACLKNLF
jgi:predicted transposase YbfD/YdcC